MKKLPLFVILVLVLALVGGAPAAMAQAGPQSCYCVTPKKAGGTAAGGGVVKIKWGTGNPATGGATATVNTVAGQTPGQIAQGLANQLAAQLPNPVGPVVVDPATGRAVFCVQGKKPNLFGYSETDKGIKTITYQLIRHAGAWFLHNVGGAWIASAVALGGSVAYEVGTVDADGDTGTVVAEVTTFPGDSGFAVTLALLDELNAAGLAASLGEWDFGDGSGFQPAIIIEPGIYSGITSLGISSDDEGLFELRVAGSDDPDGLLADFNGDGLLDSKDFDDFATAFMRADPAADVDGNGLVSEGDLVLYLSRVTVDVARPPVPAKLLPR